MSISIYYFASTHGRDRGRASTTRTPSGRVPASAAVVVRRRARRRSHRRRCHRRRRRRRHGIIIRYKLQTQHTRAVSYKQTTAAAAVPSVAFSTVRNLRNRTRRAQLFFGRLPLIRFEIRPRPLANPVDDAVSESCRIPNLFLLIYSVPAERRPIA